MANAIYPKWKEARLQATANAALNASAALVCAVAVLGEPMLMPTVNPPV